MNAKKPRIALWFRYGPADHTLLFHALPEIIEKLSEKSEIHYFGLRTKNPIPKTIENHAVLHLSRISVDRTCQHDKIIKTALWILMLPWIGLKCRWMKMQVVFIDEAVPASAILARIFFGKNVAITVADFFPEIYFGDKPLLAPFVKFFRAIEFSFWRRLPLIFTRAKSTCTYLENKGFAASALNPVYDPCNFEIYRPLDRDACRRKYGYGPDDFVLVHHGILHPNKGNDRILRALAAVKGETPQVRYLLIGDGPEMSRLRSIVEELELTDTVQFTGWLPTLTEVNKALNAGDAGLVMRTGMQADNFHMTGALIHSMAVGLPILGASLAGVREVIREGENGLLFDPNDMAEFQKKLQMLTVDEVRQRSMGKRALESAKELFDVDRVAEATAKPLIALAGRGSTE